MGGLSNQLLVVTIFSYVLAMMAYAVEYAFGSSSVVARRALVGAGGPTVYEDAPAPSTGAQRAGLAAVALTVLGYAAHLGALVTRGIAAGRAPWGNMYEFVMMATLVG